MITNLTLETKIELSPFEHVLLITKTTDSGGAMSLRIGMDEIKIPAHTISYVSQGGSFKNFIKDTGSILSLVNNKQAETIEEAMRKAYFDVRKIIKDYQ